MTNPTQTTVRLRPDEYEKFTTTGIPVELTLASPCEDEKYQTVTIVPPDY